MKFYNIFCLATLLGIFSLALSSASKVDYTGHVVIRVIPETVDHLNLLRKWRSTISSLDFWSFSGRIGDPVDIHLSPEMYSNALQGLNQFRMNHQIIIDDLGQKIKEEEEAIQTAAMLNSGKAFDTGTYHSFDQIVEHMAELANTYSIVSTRSGGVTEERRPILQTIISSDRAGNKSVVFIDCNSHPREWITGSTCVWIIEELVTRYGSDPEITNLVDRYDWKFIPIANPDGYTYSMSNDRFWNKNRRTNPSTSCHGVDIDRNFEVGFGGSGSSDVVCNEYYHGDNAYSEPESLAIKNLISGDRGRVIAAFSLHSYGQKWMSPYLSNFRRPVESVEMTNAMAAGVEALTAVYGTKYTYGSGAALNDLASGVSTDYFYEVEGIVHSYTLELRDTGINGYMMPVTFIRPTAEETFEGIKGLLKEIDP